MKLIEKKNFDKNGKGSIKLVAEESEDLWHLYNIVAEDDEIQAVTWRKVPPRDGKGDPEVKKLRLTIEVKKIEYDAKGDNIRFSGQVCAENDFVKMGAHHTIEIELNEMITLTKTCWDAVYLEQLELATDMKRSAEVAVVLLEAKDEAQANVFLQTQVLTKRVANIQHPLPSKRISDTQLNKALEKFNVKLFEQLKKSLDLDMLKCCVLAGPGKAKNIFMDWMKTYAMQKGEEAFTKKVSIFICANASSIHNQGLEDIMSDAMVQKKMKDTKAAKHFGALEELQRRVANEPERQCYGLKDVMKARDAGAIDVMMISDELFRSTTLSTRKQYVELVEEVKNMGNTKVHIFSSGHVTGQALGKLTGIAAILRFQIDYDLDEEDVAAAELSEQSAAPAASPIEAPRDVQKLVRQDSAPQRAQAVMELSLALGGSAADDRIHEALKSANKVVEDAYLALLAEELDGGGKQLASDAQDASFVPPARPAAKPAPKPAAKPAAKAATKPAAKPAAKAGGKKQKPAARLNTGDWDDWGDW